MVATIRQKRGDATAEAWSLEGGSEAGNADMMRYAFTRAKQMPGDVFEVEGIYDFGASLEGAVVMPSGTRDNPITIRGVNNPILKSGINSDKLGSAFVIWNTNLESLSLVEMTLAPHEDGRALGFDVVNKAGMRFRPNVDVNLGPTANLRKCSISSSVWGIYFWFDFPLTLTGSDLIVSSGRICLAMCSSGSKPQNTSIQRSQFFVKTARSNDYGATSCPRWGGALAAIYRNGNHQLTDVTIDLRWSAQPPVPDFPARRCVAVTDMFGEQEQSEQDCLAQSSTRITARDLRVLSYPDTADRSLCWDFDLRNPEVKRTLELQGDCQGSGQYRSMLIR